MAVQTPSTRTDTIWGDKRVILATFASVANGDTFATGFGLIQSISIESGVSTATVGATFSGGTITFVTSATATGVQLIVVGY